MTGLNFTNNQTQFRLFIFDSMGFINYHIFPLKFFKHTFFTENHFIWCNHNIPFAYTMTTFFTFYIKNKILFSVFLLKCKRKNLWNWFILCMYLASWYHEWIWFLLLDHQLSKLLSKLDTIFWIHSSNLQELIWVPKPYVDH